MVANMRLLLFLIIFCSSVPVFAQDKLLKDGGCDYEKFPVKAKITSVKNLSSASLPDQTKYEVRFVILVTPQLPPKIENRVYGRDYHLLLRNKTFPGPLYLEKYDISTGKIFDCYYYLINRGTCRPSFFDFPDIKLDDYFESQPQN